MISPGRITPTFYTDDVLTHVSLMPQHAWDKTSMTGKVGNYDESPTGAKAVWNFLQKEGGQQSTFATNPLWQVVDGPFKLSQFDSSGYYAYVPNKNYSANKPALSKVIWTPFTDDTALMDTLRSGTSVSVAVLPLNDVRQIPALRPRATRWRRCQPRAWPRSCRTSGTLLWRRWCASSTSGRRWST